MKWSYPSITLDYKTHFTKHNTELLTAKETTMVLQIIHIKTLPQSGHWVALQIFENDEVHL